MADRKVINLDALIPDKEYVQLDGVEHEIRTVSVETYMTIMKSRQRLKMADPDLEAMQQSIMLIELSCPTIPKERLSQLPLRALTALADRIQAQMEADDESEDPDAEEATAETGE